MLGLSLVGCGVSQSGLATAGDGGDAVDGALTGPISSSDGRTGSPGGGGSNGTLGNGGTAGTAGTGGMAGTGGGAVGTRSDSGVGTGAKADAAVVDPADAGSVTADTHVADARLTGLDTAAAPLDAATTFPDSAPARLDTAPEAPPALNTVECGETDCPAARQYCCATKGEVACRDKDKNCPGASRDCDGPEDCNHGEICCAQTQMMGGFRSTCTSAPECKGGAPLCHRTSDCAGGSCCPQTLLLMTVGVCQNTRTCQ